MALTPPSMLVLPLVPLVLALALPFASGCIEGDNPEVADGGMARAAGPEFVPDSFEKLYPTFLTHKLPASIKGALWQRYRGKWVHWTGTVVSFSDNGITLKQLPQTSTFDVSLFLPTGRRALERARLHPGQRVSYVGRLDSYDDIFRTLYLTMGSVAPASPAPATR